jgi:hypothetical protein
MDCFALGEQCLTSSGGTPACGQFACDSSVPASCEGNVLHTCNGIGIGVDVDCSIGGGRCTSGSTGPTCTGGGAACTASRCEGDVLVQCDCRLSQGWDPGFSKPFPLGPHARDRCFVPELTSSCPA